MTGLLALPLCFLGGLLLGLVHFSALRATAALIVGGGSALLGLVLTLGRVALLGAGLCAAAQGGALALLAAAAGVLVARALMLRRGRVADA
ncbi:MAG: hypothetical protein COW75_07055 [Rhodobacterales bacterium CG18_big_fil_WC_8_21_14_2_50_71_9]|nr:MAG: hypothetical protein COW75_07055 [Rhodobacterales bacterium CG18_big_fil_WC_8_21_14_2_50_71_9]PIY73589.1 MAG: hypothetical protein COY86_05610 [Rhodobacterales bacterium CG_4_10_14_0_8_um_filter_70_9]PJA60049.1 MAG: hypothetical protein CO163_05940 [Rhodobacterales bacterium CG_4_9_14_3_um_filter_71_31]